jgi:hypothetical protein
MNKHLKSALHFGPNGNLTWVIALLLAVCGCSTTKQEQLESAAKDWCATIRASQVIPVYPLTEDVQPGDIFLVQLTVDQQQQIYRQRGYLPMDNLLDRLNPGNYANFYSHNFLKDNTNAMLPADWIRPGGHTTNSWGDAPSAAFPTYSFSVQHGAGINMAFPVEGVPIGLSLLGSDAAEGSVIIKNAHTIGVDMLSVYNQLKTWAATNYDFLSYFGTGDKPNYLRVVTRIYTVGSVDISLRDVSSQSGGLDVGAAKPVNLLAPQLMQGTNADSATIRSNFVAGNTILQDLMTNALAAKDALGNVLPGGSLRLTSASGRTISMRETFDPPLTIGYIGFDCTIQRGGQLGRPVPTFSVLDNKFSLANRLGGNKTALIYSGVIESSIYNIVAAQSDTDSKAKKIQEQMDALSNFIPSNPRRYSYDTATKILLERDSLAIGASDYRGFRRYIGERQTGLAALNEALAEKDLQCEVDVSGTKTPAKKVDAALRQNLELTRDVLSRPLPPEEEDAINEASSALVNYFIQQLNP